MPADNTFPGNKKQELSALENRLHKLEEDISANQGTLKEIKHMIESFGSKDMSDVLHDSHTNDQFANKHIRNRVDGGVDFGGTKVSVSPPIFNQSSSSIEQDDCIFAETPPSSVDIQMKDVYDILPFDNVDGGSWKQGWQIAYDENQWSAENKLKIFVIPHSHNDPGWIKTFDAYFKEQTRHILDNMVIKLAVDHRRKFIWAEISYFAEWWVLQSDDVKASVRRFLERGQLEIVTGGWVMPDEASTHFTSMLDQLITGHEWMRVHLGIKPNNGWSIDPFGMSPTMAYLLKRSGFQNMLIQRTHYSVKKHLAREKALEFRWRQVWDVGTNTEILCHMMPFYSYDVPHTCGPDPKVCCQFDFRRLPRMGMTCPWRVPPQPITHINVKSRAQLLLDQYRKKAQLFRTNVLLVPLGDDFRYDREDEWDLQFGNYQQLFDYMNSRADLHVQVQFGTLGDYFGALRLDSSTNEDLTHFPSLSGDFFAYADRDDHYWTGYYTTRPFLKRLDRILQSYLRTAEIFFAFLLEKSSYDVGNEEHSWVSSLMKNIIKAREDHGLFQHHDGITGTAKDHVVQDYALRLVSAIQNCQHVIQQAIHALISDNSKISPIDTSRTVFFELEEKFAKNNMAILESIFKISTLDPCRLFLINSDAQRRQHIITVKVDSLSVIVRDRSGDPILCQISPVFVGSSNVLQDEFHLSFYVNLDPMSVTEYTLTGVDLANLDDAFTTFAKVHYTKEGPPLPKVFAGGILETEEPIILKSSSITVSFTPHGLLQHIKTSASNIDVNVKFLSYGSRGSGAYLFLPNGKGREIIIMDAPIVTIEGVYLTKLILYAQNFEHHIVLKNSPGVDGLAVEINNYVDIKRERDYELAMKISSGIKTGNFFFTDLNGFQIIKRTTYSKIPLQGNVYPMSSQMYIEDQDTRLSLLSAQPLGVGSFQEGEMEVFLDRQLTLDDNRGLGQGIHDNVRTLLKFNLLLETKFTSKESALREETPAGFASLASHSLLSIMDRPTYIMQPAAGDGVKYNSHWSLGGELPSDVDLISLRVMLDGPDEKASSDIGLTLHRRGISCSVLSKGVSGTTNNGKVRLSELFPANFGDDVKQMSISQLYEGISMAKSYSLSLKPMEIYGFRLTIRK